MKYVIAVLSVVIFSGCVTMTNKEFNRQRETWQSIGRLSGLVECQNILLNDIAKENEEKKND